jgi:hypothetical protein
MNTSWWTSDAEAQFSARPELLLSAWADTCGTLQLWTQIVGRIRVAHANARFIGGRFMRSCRGVTAFAPYVSS